MNSATKLFLHVIQEMNFTPGKTGKNNCRLTFEELTAENKALRERLKQVEEQKAKNSRTIATMDCAMPICSAN
ncbi:MAG: hypothetical protein C4527_08315 [Candidatus Omnitrophota bacterium]|nr:MAG: hypothetical protein C4527_08315 [Candidatus Omnitrophota bacterium]